MQIQEAVPHIVHPGPEHFFHLYKDICREFRSKVLFSDPIYSDIVRRSDYIVDDG